MNSERWEQVANVYQEALGLDPPLRDAYLERVCGADEELRAEVASLLAQDVTGHGILERAAESSSDLLWKPDRTRLPRTLGSYRIKTLIGEGGMGAVYEAEQDHPHRTVALKLVRADMATPELLRRFQLESEALGRLHHPGIAQIYEAGTEDGQPYFAMEFIRGLPLVEYADSRKLDTRARLELFIRVCDAVEHAHRRGIVHRDLKPGNILVEEGDQPKILDFGVARITDRDARATRQTSLGELVGTLAYMSPEQVLGDPTAVDERSDVYSLGVVLSELLTGRLPYVCGTDPIEAIRVIREQDPAPFSHSHPEYRGDLETIAGKVLQKDKSVRYASAEELASDLRRFLEHRPIQARPPSTVYQLRKFARRHRTLVFALASVFVVLAGGIAATAWQAVRASEERDRARAAEQTAKAISDFLRDDLLAQASAAGQASPSTKPDPDLKVRTALERAAARIDSGKFSSRPRVEAAVRQTIAKSYTDLGLYEKGREQQERAVELWRRSAGAQNAETVKAVRELAGIYFLEGKYGLAEDVLRQVLETLRRQARQDDPEALLATNDLAITTATGKGNHTEAVALLEDVVVRERRVLGEDHLETLTAMNNLALQYSSLDRDADAERVYKQALGHMRRALGDEHPLTLLTRNNLGSTLRFLGKFQEAEEMLTGVFQARRKLLGEEHPDTMITANALGRVLLAQGKFTEAKSALDWALEINSRLNGPDHPRTASTLAAMGDLYRLRRDWAEAEKWLRKALLAHQRALGPDHPFTRFALVRLASVLMRQNKQTEAEPLLREATKGIGIATNPSWRRYYGQAVLGVCLAEMGHYQEAEPILLAGFRGMESRKASIEPEESSAFDEIRGWIPKLYERWGKNRELR